MKKKHKENELIKKRTSTIHEFKDFISRGNIVDMAVGVIIGSAFGKIVTSLVDNIFMPVVGMIIGGHDFSSLSVKIKDAEIMYGVFIQNVVDFLIVAVCMFLMIKFMAKFKKKEEVKEEAPKEDDKTVLLREIRDLLKEDK